MYTFPSNPPEAQRKLMESLGFWSDHTVNESISVWGNGYGIMLKLNNGIEYDVSNIIERVFSCGIEKGKRERSDEFKKLLNLTDKTYDNLLK